MSSINKTHNQSTKPSVPINKTHNQSTKRINQQNPQTKNPKFQNLASIKPKTSFAPWRARTRTAPVVDRGSWIANSSYGLRVAVLCGARLRVAMLCGRGSLAVLGCELVIWVASYRWSWIVGCALWSWIIGYAGLRIRDMGCGWSCWVTGGCGGFWVQ